MKCWSNEYISAEATELVVGNGKCNDNDVTSLDLSAYTALKSISFGDDCYQNVINLSIEGKNQLESLTIGMNSFTTYRNSQGSKEDIKERDKRYTYSLNNCPLLKTVEIDRYSFSNYKYLVVENLASLESIVFGDVDEVSYNFYNVNGTTFMSGCVFDE